MNKFQTIKLLLPPISYYQLFLSVTNDFFVYLQLQFPGVKITSCEVKAKETNVVTTFLKEDQLNLAHGINFGTDHKIQVIHNK